jgi:hypothetical protein
MEKITAEEFYAMIERNPSVFEHWDTPLEITEFALCSEFPITHLSKHLIFSGTDEIGHSADFTSCKSLKTATGTFHTSVWFLDSGIKKIENLTVLEPDKDGKYCNFYKCPNLHTLENWDISKPIHIEPKKFSAETKRRETLKKFLQEIQPNPLPFL